MITNCDHELVIIVPYIKMTNEIFEALQQANARGVETTLVYREKKVNQSELDRLYELDNINILHHPNVHCKMYFDGEDVIIGSLNLYDFSIANNREMGVRLKSRRFYGGDNENIDYHDRYYNQWSTDDFLNEIQDIFNGSYIEKSSRDTIREGFKIDIIVDRKQSSEEKAKQLTKIFLNKRFVSQPYENGFDIVCHNFFDRINIYYEGNHFVIETFLKEYQMKKNFPTSNGYFETESEFMFKFYPKYHNGIIKLYLDRSNRKTEDVSKKEGEEYFLAFKNGLETFFQLHREKLK